MKPTSSPATIRVDQFVAAPPEKVWRLPASPRPGSLSRRLDAEANGTRVFLEHSGFDLDDVRMAGALDRMRPGWRDVVLPRLVQAAEQA
jgi:hypothetical protein